MSSNSTRRGTKHRTAVPTKSLPQGPASPKQKPKSGPDDTVRKLQKMVLERNEKIDKLTNQVDSLMANNMKLKRKIDTMETTLGIPH